MTWRNPVGAWPGVLLVLALILTGCSAQVTGMQSPVLHDYGEIEWVPLDRQMMQRFIAGTGYSAAIENDPATTPEEYIDRLADLPPDATSGTLKELRIGLRVPGAEGAWSTGAHIAIPPANDPDNPRAGRLQLFEVDRLPRSGDTVIIDVVPEYAAGEIVSFTIVPGDGQQADLLEVAITPHRAPYAGWRMTVDDEPQLGALVFETRYVRDVALGDVVRSGLERVTGGGAGFVSLWGVTCLSLVAGVVVLGRRR